MKFLRAGRRLMTATPVKLYPVSGPFAVGLDLLWVHILLDMLILFACSTILLFSYLPGASINQI